MHKEDTFSKIDQFFDEMKEQIEIRKHELKNELTVLLKPEMDNISQMIHQFESWQENAAKMEK